MDDSVEDSKYPILGFQALFKFEVLIPKRMCKEVEADTVSTTLKESRNSMLVPQSGGGGCGERGQTRRVGANIIDTKHQA